MKSGAQTGAVTLIQRFGSALNLNVHFHMLYLDGVYNQHGTFCPLKPPMAGELDHLTQTIAHRVTHYLEKTGYLVRDAESAYLDLYTEDDDAMAGIVGSSITYRLASGPHAGRKALTLRTIPPATPSTTKGKLVSQQSGFSLHAGVACKAKQRKKRERLCRYITRPAISEQRLSLASNGNVIYTLKRPYDDGTTHVVLSPLEFIGRLAALVPKPRVNLTRFHGVFSPHNNLRSKVVPTKTEPLETDKPKGYGMAWAQRLKRVFAIDIERCDHCGGTLKVIASIEDPAVIKQILDHLKKKATNASTSLLESRAPPEDVPAGLFD